MRRVVVDTETTGLDFSQGHRIIEIACVELLGRRMSGETFHHYINPQRDIDEAAFEIHGITAQTLKSQPLFAAIAEELLAFIQGAELIIHNAPFDVAFLNGEFERAGRGGGVVEAHCEIIDTLVMARHKHPGQRNSLDVLCKRYSVDNTQRTLHGALLDAEILADVYLAMTGGQATLLGDAEKLPGYEAGKPGETESREIAATPRIRACDEEAAQHDKWLQRLEEQSGGEALWRRFDTAG
ncbi:MAG: DNA polymerase III subunit epsilon [Gammaproteobacteria bacterium]